MASGRLWARWWHIGVLVAVVMAYYFQYGDRDPFKGKSDAERLALWAADASAERLSAELEAEREAATWPK